VRGQSGGGGTEVVADVGEERAPVSGGAVLRLEAEAREVAAARRRTGEGKSWCGGERARSAVMGSCFKRGGQGCSGGGFEGVRPTHGGSGEELGGRRVAWFSTTAFHWAARCRTTVEGGGDSVTWDGATDRWLGTRRGPGR
jgi:hypothetical protein